MVGMIYKFADFVGRRYAYLIVSSLILGVVIGYLMFTPWDIIKDYTTPFYKNVIEYFTPSLPGEILERHTNPLVIIMIAPMGFTITFRSFGGALKDVKGFCFGLAVNLLVGSILCWGLSSVFLSVFMPSTLSNFTLSILPLLQYNPTLFITNFVNQFNNLTQIATGLVLIGTVPAAGMAIVWTGVLDGDVPLAVVISAGTMIIAPFLIPFLMVWLAGAFVTIDAVQMFINLLYTVLLPILGGMLLRQFIGRKRDVGKYLPLCTAVSAISAIFLMFSSINTGVPVLLKNMSLILPLIVSIVLIFPILFFSAYVLSRKLFTFKKTVALTYSSGMKSLPVALGIAATSFKGLVSLPVAVGFVFQMLTAVVFYQLLKRMEQDVENQFKAAEEETVR
ncbi:MAG: bile acid:sodium symporter [Candidatus Freyarchaeota archaeon]|nr:bile acid:sodium symporter [Candidatus Jordarchaeia archaeon]